MPKIENKETRKAFAKIPEESVLKLDQKIGDRLRDQQVFKFKQEASNEITHTCNFDDWLKSATRSLGTADHNLISYLLTQVVNTSYGRTMNNEAEHLNNLTPMLRGINPQDELEGMLACQMVGVHNLAMEMMRRTISQNQTVDGVERNVNQATKLLRTFTTQMEALSRYRGKGQQKMTVEHVHVHQGGQAIVGSVKQGGGGGNGK